MFKIEKTMSDTINNHTYFDSAIKTKLHQKIQNRFQYFVEQAKSFVIEDYIENEWRDSYDLYYSKTIYQNCKNLVKRIHFLNKEISDIKEIEQDLYIGYINIRPIPQAEISRIRFKCTAKAFGNFSDENIYCLSIDTVVNLPHLSIHYLSFPVYSQDGMVAICAHADLLMISKYMYKKFNFNNYKLKDIIENNIISPDNGRKVPSEGLNLLQILSILKVNNYNPISTRFVQGKYNTIHILDYINSFLESGLPVIIAFKRHVILVVGHMHNEHQHYVIVDDSSYHVTQSFKKVEAHVAIISEEELMSEFNSCEVFVVAPTFDRFYLHYQYLKLIINHECENLKAKYEALEVAKSHTINIKTREILVESSVLKQFLHKCGDDSYENVLMPHYVWYIEFYVNKIMLSTLSHYLIVDASAHKYDRKYSIIEDYNGDGMHFAGKKMIVKQQLSRLQKI